MELSTFRTVDNRFDITVKTEFLKKCPDYLTTPVFDLMTKFKMNQYIHNPAGPAITKYNKDGQVIQIDYWVEGQVVPKEVGERMAHNHAFGNKILDTINK